MIIPYSIPNWLQIQRNAKNYKLDIHFRIDPLTGKHSGDFTFQGKIYPFKLEIFSQNMVMSFKEYNPELIKAWCAAIEEKYRVVYQTAGLDFNIHTEWYFNVSESLVMNELERMKRANNIKVIHML